MRVTSGPTRKLPNWGLPLSISLSAVKSAANSSGEIDLLNFLNMFDSEEEKHAYKSSHLKFVIPFNDIHALVHNYMTCTVE